MDVAKLLREARESARLSQGQLGDAAGTSGSAVCSYERGTVSPTVRTLDRLLAAAGLRMRVTLEPLLADLDERVDVMLQTQPAPDVASLEYAHDSFDSIDGVHVSWAFDGTTALELQGLGVSDEGRHCVVVQFDEDARRWMT